MNWGIYVHVPWCKRRCIFCDFYVKVGTPNDIQFTQKIATELEARSPDYHSNPSLSLYFGGGTPSLLDPQAIAKIISHAKEGKFLEQDAEITLEANPENVVPRLAQGLFSAGVTRISLGAQSFEDHILKDLTRDHRAKDNLNALEILIESGFKNISVDLMIGIPKESSKAIEDGISRVIEAGVTHFSLYLLTIKEKTPLKKMIASGKRESIDDDRQADIYEQIQTFLKNAGFEQYEISNFSKPTRESQHNRLYWGKGDYLGVGPSAHSMRLESNGSVIRRANLSSYNSWVLDPIKSFEFEECLSPYEALIEALAFGLRDMKSGIILKELEEKHKALVPQNFNIIINKYNGLGIVKSDGKSIFLTSKGALFADAIMREIIGLL